MRLEDVPARLAAIHGRAPGSDAERRAAAWLRDLLREEGEHVVVETVWVRPDWALVYAAYVLLAVIGSALSVSSPPAGLALTGVALAALVADLAGAVGVTRWLSPSRATQNVIASDGDPRRPPAPGRLRLIVTANVDAGRCGAVYRDGLVRAEAGLRRRLGGRLASMRAVLAALVLALAAFAGARLAGASGGALGALQLVPTVALLVALALLVDIALSSASPGANVNASGVAAALAVLRELRRSPPSQLDVDLVLAGAGEGGALGLGALLRERRRRGWRAEDVAVLAVEPCAVGTPRYLTHDGPLVALRLHPQLLACARAAAASEPLLGARAARGHGTSGAYPARLMRWPAIAIGALDEHDRPGPARQPGDVPARVDQRVLADTVELCLALVERLDAGLTAGGRSPAAAQRRA